ncbi:MAG: hypothetical protein GF333_04815 [Candidatus Omnitrophica bacterium]|nr:hypothetical protein [Candidatus Omnitrophota bacterium]
MMKEQFNIGEIFRLAMQVEQNGKKLYGELASRAETPAVREIWNYLKEQEAVHWQIFEKMLAEAEESDIYEYQPGEYQAYIRAIAENYVFTAELVKGTRAESFSSEREAVDFGIFIEKESILTYSALQEYLPAEKQPAVEKIIQEEKNHYVRLTALKKTVLSRRS